MNQHRFIAQCSPWPPLCCRRLLLVALAALMLCSCRGQAQQHAAVSLPGQPAAAPIPGDPLPVGAAHHAPPGNPASPAAAYGPVGAMAARSAVLPLVAPGMERGVPLPAQPAGPWAPPGIGQPWPEDEYLRDGGDAGLPAQVGEQWEVRGLELEDTVAHFDTLDGQTIVEPSNPVFLYSPRFGAVRKVDTLAASEQMDRAGGVHLASRLIAYEEQQLARVGTQQFQLHEGAGARPAVAMRTRWGDGAVSSATRPLGFQDAFMPYENLKIIREGLIEAAEMAWLSRGVAAAEAWTNTQAVQVILDHQAAMAAVGDQKLQAIYTINEPPPQPRLRVIKVASTQFANPGEDVWFTIRFDNVGNQLIGNVTIIDNLSPRLEYVADSAQCSLPAQFLAEPNEGDSVVLRCEVTDPLPPGEGGVIRFRCRVR